MISAELLLKDFSSGRSRFKTLEQAIDFAIRSTALNTASKCSKEVLRCRDVDSASLACVETIENELEIDDGYK